MLQKKSNFEFEIVSKFDLSLEPTEEMNFDNVVKCSIFLKDMKQYTDVNKVYAEYFNENPPAREAVEVSVLPRNVNIEISLIAVK